ncbi:APC family permease [Pseudomonas abieticivorans]|uniref:APC family permease n=1 Tax=Pseudomonas abieticivorans TaxID=2931382 RepID=UPI0020C052D5|nr:APC family permease [Pseudomonas sp. PIA16]
MPNSESRPVNGGSAGTLAHRVGAWQLMFFVIAAAAPLGFSLGAIPLLVGRGGVAGGAVVFLLAALVLAIFAVGYIAMAARLSRVGGLYGFVSEGLGPMAGAGASYVALLVYACAAIGGGGAFAVFLDATALDLLGFSMPWYFWALGMTLLIGVLGTRSVAVNARVLGVVITLEVAILVVLSLAILLKGGPEGLSLIPVSPFGGIDSHAGVQFAIAISAFAGFEATVLYSREAKDRKRTIRNATFGSLALMGGLYALVTWAIISAYGVSNAMNVANTESTTLFFTAANTYLGSWAVKVLEVLVVASWFASVLAFHNATARYLAAMASDGLVPRKLAFLHPRFGSPWVASITMTCLALAVTCIFIAANGDPYLDLYVLGSAPAVIGIPALEVLASLAILAFFRRSGMEAHVFQRLIAPIVASLLIGFVLITILLQMDIFTGRTGWVNWIIPGSIVIAMLLGMVRFKGLKQTNTQNQPV